MHLGKNLRCGHRRIVISFIRYRQNRKKNLKKMLDSCLANKMVPMSKPNFKKLLSYGELVELSLGWSMHKQVWEYRPDIDDSRKKSVQLVLIPVVIVSSYSGFSRS